MSQLRKKHILITTYLCLLAFLSTVVAHSYTPKQQVIRGYLVDFLAADSHGLIGARQIGSVLNICRVDPETGNITVLATLNISDGLCMGFDWFYRYYVLTYNRLLDRYEIWILNDVFAILDRKVINIDIPDNIRLFSLAVNASNFWVGYYTLSSPYLAGVLKLDSELSEVLDNITFSPPPNFQGNAYYIVDLDVYSRWLFVYDITFDVYTVDPTGTRDHIVNVYDNSSEFREQNNVTMSYPSGIAVFNEEIYACMHIVWTEGRQTYEGSAFLAYPAPKPPAPPPVPPSGTEGVPRGRLSMITICSVFTFLFAVAISKTSLMVLPKTAEKPIGKEELALKKAEGTAETVETPKVAPAITDDVIKEFEQSSGAINKIRKILGVRKIFGVAKRYKDKKPRPNFDYALGQLAILGVIIGTITYFLYKVDIFTALGMNIGMLISVGGLLAAIIMLILWRKRIVEFTKKISILITAIYIPLSIYGIIINLATIVDIVAVLAVIEAVVAVFITLRELVIFLIGRGLLLIAFRKQ